MALDHYAARTYLKRWSGPKQPMQAYRKSDLNSFPCWPGDVCAEPDGDLNPGYFADPAALGNYRAIFEPNWDVAVEAVKNGLASAEHKFIISGYWQI